LSISQLDIFLKSVRWKSPSIAFPADNMMILFENQFYQGIDVSDIDLAITIDIGTVE
jgi:hypothetical protein